MSIDLVLWQFFVAHQRYPAVQNPKDDTELLRIRTDYLEKIQVDSNIVPTELVMYEALM